MLHGSAAKGAERAVITKSAKCQDCGCYIYYHNGSGHYRKYCMPCAHKRYAASQRASARKIRAGGAADWNAGKRAENDTVSAQRLAEKIKVQVAVNALPGFCSRCGVIRLSKADIHNMCTECLDDLAEVAAEKKRLAVDY